MIFKESYLVDCKPYRSFRIFKFYKMKSPIIFLFLLSSIQLIAQDKDIESCLNLMQIQQDAWNKGDIPAFMEGYWKNEGLKFIGAKGITQGWQNTLDRYLKGYPDRQTMGTLTFGYLAKEKISKKIIHFVGTYHLSREGMEDAKGVWSLLFKKIKGEWLIIADHSSADEG